MNIFRTIKLLLMLKKAQKQGRKDAVEYKNFLQSKTIWGFILIIIGLLKQKFGWDFTDAQVESWLNIALEVIGTILGVYGRIRADKPLKVN